VRRSAIRRCGELLRAIEPAKNQRLHSIGASYFPRFCRAL